MPSRCSVQRKPAGGRHRYGERGRRRDPGPGSVGHVLAHHCSGRYVGRAGRPAIPHHADHDADHHGGAGSGHCRDPSAGVVSLTASSVTGNSATGTVAGVCRDSGVLSLLASDVSRKGPNNSRPPGSIPGCADRRHGRTTPPGSRTAPPHHQTAGRPHRPAAASGRAPQCTAERAPSAGPPHVPS